MGSEGQSAVKDFHFEEKKREREKKKDEKFPLPFSEGTKSRVFSTWK